MQNTWNYIYSAEGKKEAVIIPIVEWLKIQADFEELKRYLAFYDEIREAVVEARYIHKNTKNPQTLTDFLNEC